MPPDRPWSSRAAPARARALIRSISAPASAVAVTIPTGGSRPRSKRSAASVCRGCGRLCTWRRAPRLGLVLGAPINGRNGGPPQSHARFAPHMGNSPNADSAGTSGLTAAVARLIARREPRAPRKVSDKHARPSSAGAIDRLAACGRLTCPQSSPPSARVPADRAGYSAPLLMSEDVHWSELERCSIK